MIFIITFSPLFFGGCNQQKETIEQATVSGSVSIKTDEGKAKFIYGDTLSSTKIGGVFDSIVISGNVLTYSGIFTIAIPKESNMREYNSNKSVFSEVYIEWIGFSDKAKEKTTSIHITTIPPENIKLSEQNLCKKEYMETPLSIKYTTKILQGRTIYISTTVGKTSGLGVTAKTIKETLFCFVNRGVLYNFDLTNYEYSYGEKAINSIIFY
ncbi:MAG: hypothetical protein NTY80_01130 [candidate division SR1 bacterium]|nr:hypothetical protein [candidate division SR1 bacterium]